MDVGVELELELEPELELGLWLPAAAPVDVRDAVHKSFVKRVHNSSAHKSVQDSFMMVVSVL